MSSLPSSFSIYKKEGNIDFIFGLDDYGKKATLLYPRPKIWFISELIEGYIDCQNAIDSIFNAYTDKEIYEAILSNKILKIHSGNL